ncbi:GntR family transcriptional regulator [Romboutsia sp. MSSM.1001216sp_RTP31141st1_G3_RTP31141_220114]|uniref:GntR family transcriptional regulator n=1 Tax=unclassified Romboutsia TaxID=2626894 RepID=UPI0031B5B304
MGQPIYKIIENYVKELINSGKLNQGDLIPSEHQLCEEFNVTRMTVRSALNNLVKEGYIARRRGIGSIVLGSKVYDNISSISGFTKEMNSKGYKVSSILVSLEKIEADDEISEKLNISEGDYVWEIKRVRLANDKRLSYMITYMPYKLFPNINETHCKGSLYEYVEEVSGRKIAISEREVEAVISNDELEENLKLDRKEPLLYIKQVCRLDNGEAFEYSHTYHYGYTLTVNAISK